jgi:hypothetical protein
MSEGRVVKATIKGRTYTIPDIWLAGFCWKNKCSVADAVAWWHEQQLMEDD